MSNLPYFDDIILFMIHSITDFIFTQLYCTRLQRQNKEGTPVKKRFHTFSFNIAFANSAKPVLQKVIVFEFFLGILTVHKALQVFSGTKRRVSLSQRACSLQCQPLKEFHRVTVPEWSCDEMDLKSLTTDQDFITRPLGSVGIPNIQRGVRTLLKWTYYLIRKISSLLVCVDSYLGRSPVMPF